MSKDRRVLLVFPHPKTIFGPAEERKWRINKRRHWQRRNNYTPLYPIYINKRSLGERERKREGTLTVMVKIIFQATARHVSKRVYGCERVLHCRWNIWFSLAGLHRDSQGTIDAECVSYCDINHSSLTYSVATPGTQQVFLKALLDDLCNVPHGLPCDNCFQRYDRPWGFNASDADPASPRLEHIINNHC